MPIYFESSLNICSKKLSDSPVEMLPTPSLKLKQLAAWLTDGCLTRSASEWVSRSHSMRKINDVTHRTNQNWESRFCFYFKLHLFEKTERRQLALPSQMSLRCLVVYSGKTHRQTGPNLFCLLMTLTTR